VKPKQSKMPDYLSQNFWAKDVLNLGPLWKKHCQKNAFKKPLKIPLQNWRSNSTPLR